RIWTPTLAAGAAAPPPEGEQFAPSDGPAARIWTPTPAAGAAALRPEGEQFHAAFVRLYCSRCRLGSAAARARRRARRALASPCSRRRPCAGPAARIWTPTLAA